TWTGWPCSGGCAGNCRTCRCCSSPPRTPSRTTKGLEYDATVVVSPAEIADESPAGLRVLYVALTRATQQLTVVSADRDEPDAAGVADLLRD
ncbi:ATP-binding domain-containing protein, partial [Streptomyces sp. NPDC006265]|uniref:ATP-binding domain-containing protein n=1 Tax=Streptomyces sp. NPDC006265 TaxID=3156740 RepID=UPI0033AD4EA4